MKEFNDAINHTGKEIQEIAHALRQIMLEQDENIAEDVIGGEKVKIIYYSIGHYNNAIGGITASKDHCKLFLHHYNSYDHKGLKFEGKGKYSRHIKVRSLMEAQLNSIRHVISSTVTISKGKEQDD